MVRRRADAAARPDSLMLTDEFLGPRYNIYKDHITLEDYEIHDGMGLELYYN